MGPALTSFPRKRESRRNTIRNGWLRRMVGIHPDLVSVRRLPKVEIVQLYEAAGCFGLLS
jgi:hypothetical protein